MSDSNETLDGFLAEAKPDQPAGLKRAVGLRNVLMAINPLPRRITQLGRFAVETRIGGGGMGEVFLAVDKDSDERVAIKVLKRSHPELVKRFDREARTLRAIEHDSVVRYVAHGLTEDQSPWLAMEWIEGCELSDRTDNGPLPVRAALALVLKLAGGLSAAHAQGIVHRDLKPSNIMLVNHDPGQPKLIDFGIARSVMTNRQETKLTRTGMAVGSPAYMAPEQVHGRPDQRTDVYGLGAVLFECLTGRPPFVGLNQGAMLVAVLGEIPPSVRALQPDIPRDVDALVAAMLAKEPHRRPADIDAVAAEVAALLATPLAPPRHARGLSLREQIPNVPLPAPIRADQPPPLVGRARERGLLIGALSDAVEQHAAAAVMVVGPSGSGRSRLLEEGLDALPEDTVVAHANALPQDPAVPFSTLRRLLRDLKIPPRLFELMDPEIWRQAVDPRRYADQLALAWHDWIEHVTDTGLLVFAIDDGDRIDRASRRLVEQALAQSVERPLAVVVTSADGAIHLGTTLPDSRRTRVAIGPLGRTASKRLAEHWLGTTELDDWHLRSEGWPGHLAELCLPSRRPGSVQEMWRRLDALAEESRRALRACALVGRSVWEQAVARVLGVREDDVRVSTLLNGLVDADWLEPEITRVQGTRGFRFRSEVAFQATLDRCTAEDLRFGNAVVGEWKRAARAFEPSEVAEHFHAAERYEQAMPEWLAAARAALAGGMPTVAENFLAQAEICAQSTHDYGRLHAMRAQAAYWRGNVRDAAEEAQRGLDQLTSGEPAWFELASLAITAVGQAGKNDEVDALAQRVIDAPPGDAVSPRMAAIGRAAAQLGAAMHPGYSRLKGILDQTERFGLSAEARAWLWRSRAYTSVLHNLQAGLDAFVLAHGAHVEAGDIRAAALMSVFLTNAMTLLGNWEAARVRLADVQRVVDRLGSPYLSLWVDYARCKYMTEQGAWPETRALLQRVIQQGRGSPRVHYGAQVYLGIGALRAGLPQEAWAPCEAVVASTVAPETRLGAQAVLIRASVMTARTDRVAEWLANLDDAIENGRQFVDHTTLIDLARVEGHEHIGNPEKAKAAHTDALDRMRRRCETLDDPRMRNLYQFSPHAAAALQAWAPEDE
ncbi:MAG: serine/threonine-protein kinase [Myxococcota bacterium]